MLRRKFHPETRHIVCRRVKFSSSFKGAQKITLYLQGIKNAVSRVAKTRHDVVFLV